MFGVDPKQIADGMAKIDTILAGVQDIQRRLAAIEAKLGLEPGIAPPVSSQPNQS